MSPEVYLTFIVASVVLFLTPGPAMTLIVANSASFGPRAGLVTVGGNTVGLGVLLGAVIAGLSYVLLLMADYFDWIRWIGALYLVWLGISRIRASTGPLAGAQVAASNGNRRYFWQGLLVGLSNPKVLLFYGAFFPQFVDFSHNVGHQLLVLAVTFLVLALAVDGGMALAASRAGKWLASRKARLIDRVGGMLLIAGGLWLAFARR
ncbi:MAG: LysE family translocator [Hyphomicrobiales bacterium]